MSVKTVLLLICLALTSASSLAIAASASNAQQAAQIALQQNGGGGKVLGVSSSTDSNGQRVFAVKLLVNGRVRIVRIPQG